MSIVFIYITVMIKKNWENLFIETEIKNSSNPLKGQDRNIYTCESKIAKIRLKPRLQIKV